MLCKFDKFIMSWGCPWAFLVDIKTGGSQSSDYHIRYSYLRSTSYSLPLFSSVFLSWEKQTWECSLVLLSLPLWHVSLLPQLSDAKLQCKISIFPQASLHSVTVFLLALVQGNSWPPPLMVLTTPAAAWTDLIHGSFSTSNLLRNPSSLFQISTPARETSWITLMAR